MTTTAVTDELTKLYERINISTLAARASGLRRGLPRLISPLHYDNETQSSITSGNKYHTDVCFGDGIKWTARICRSTAKSHLKTLPTELDP